MRRWGTGDEEIERQIAEDRDTAPPALTDGLIMGGMSGRSTRGSRR